MPLSLNHNHQNLKMGKQLRPLIPIAQIHATDFQQDLEIILININNVYKSF